MTDVDSCSEWPHASAFKRRDQLLHLEIQQELARLVRSMNCYYSNFLEGHQTTPREIERALRSDFSNDSKQRILQYEALAHIQVQQLIDAGEDPQASFDDLGNAVRKIYIDLGVRIVFETPLSIAA